VDKLDQEFKMFMRWRGINIDNNLFDLRFNEPQNFAKYRQAEVDQVRITTFTQLEPIPYLSKRFLLERYLDLSEEEMTRNDELWAQENGTVQDTELPDAGLRAVGVTNAGIQQDLESVEPIETTPGAVPGAGPESVGAPASQPAAGAGAPGGGLGL
jgi:hypothetical protein